VDGIGVLFFFATGECFEFAKYVKSAKVPPNQHFREIFSNSKVPSQCQRVLSMGKIYNQL
jgi:hypothetical protein